MDRHASRGARSEGGSKRAGRNSKGSAGAHRAVARINQGTMVTLGGPARFARFDATLTDELKKNLEIIARVVGPKPHRIIVRGHATPEPIPSDSEILSTVIGCSLPLRGEKAATRLLTVRSLQIQDQFDLSFARARAVADFLLAHGIPKHRILVSASGDTEQRLLTRRKAGQNLNRRVDVFLIDSYITRPKSGGPRAR